jgi:CDP-4-dehydro-6-deoxyglucose reductase
MVKNGDSILDAALEQGIPLPHQCRGASCGECKSRVHVGAVDHGWSLGFAITEEEKAQGFCLACQAKPITDLVEIETLRPVGGADLVVQTSATVLAAVAVTPRVLRLTVAPEKDVTYEAGSYAEIVLPGVKPNRVYSFTTPPRPDRLLEFFVALHPGGKSSEYIHKVLKVGDRIDVRAPFGSCRMPKGTGPVLGLAGGTGLAPVLAIFEESLESGSAAKHLLVFSVREDAEVFALERLESLARRFPQFSYELVVTDAPSRHCEIQQFVPQWVQEKLQTLAGYRAVIGGSPGFVQACSETCRELGMEEADMATDSFNPQEIN